MALTAGFVVLTIRVHEEDGLYLALCEELGVPSFGKSHEEALQAVRDAVEVYVNTLEEEGERERVFKERGVEIIPARQVKGRTVRVDAHPGECVMPTAFQVDARATAVAVG